MPAVEKGLFFNTGPYGDSPLEIKILKSCFLHARQDQKIGPEPKCRVPRSSNGWYYREQLKGGYFLTLDHMGTPPPLKIKKMKIGLRHVLSRPKLSLEAKSHDPGPFLKLFLGQHFFAHVSDKNKTSVKSVFFSFFIHAKNIFGTFQTKTNKKHNRRWHSSIIL